MTPAQSVDTVTDVLVHVPPPADVASCWAKILSAVEEGDTGHALQGEWLKRNGRYELPAGALVVTAEKDYIECRMSVTLWRVDPGYQSGLASVQSWQRKSTRVGPSILAYCRRRLTPDVPRPPRACLPVEAPKPNKRRGRCQRCDRWVAVGEGLWVRNRAGFGHVEHHECPPPEQCSGCNAVGRQDRGWKIVHKLDCPQQPPAHNRRADFCIRCWGRVPAGAGLLSGGPGDWRVEHERKCPPNPLIPDVAWIWHVHELDRGAGLVCDYPAGTVVRTTIPDDSPQLPGVSVVGVVIAAITGRRLDEYGYWRDSLHTVWRAATLDEAAPVLDGEQRRTDEVRLLARVRSEFALHGESVPRDADVPPRSELDDLSLTALPTVMIPAGADVEVVASVDESRGVVWTVVRNTDQSEWRLSNLGGWTVVRHPLTPLRRELLGELAGVVGDFP